MITSPQNQRVKDAVKLRDRRGRTKQGRIIVDGCREIRLAHRSGVTWVEVFACEELCNEEATRLLHEVEGAGAPVIHVSAQVLEKLAFGDRTEGIVAVAQTPGVALDDIQLPADPLICVLENVEKPGNVGAVLRSADAAGVSAVLIADGGTDIYNPNTIRASLGSVFSVPVVGNSSRQTLDWLTQQKLQIFAARIDGATHYTEADYRGAATIVLGSEAAGLSPIWSGENVTSIFLPMRGEVDSLNISATASVLFFEALRQRTN